jgi:hypothetical protein
MVRENEIRKTEIAVEMPLLDLKPDRTLFTPIAPPQPGDSQADGIGAKLPPLITG